MCLDVRIVDDIFITIMYCVFMVVAYLVVKQVMK